jgi:hypothetical protein
MERGHPDDFVRVGCKRLLEGPLGDRAHLLTMGRPSWLLPYSVRPRQRSAGAVCAEEASVTRPPSAHRRRSSPQLSSCAFHGPIRCLHFNIEGILARGIVTCYGPDQNEPGRSKRTDVNRIHRALLVVPLLLLSLLVPVTSASAAAQYSPVGSVEPLAFFPDGSVVVYAWAADPENINQPLDVHVYVDGARGYVFRTGTHDRPDVLAARGAPNAGMVGVLPPQGPGVHQVCAYAINIGPTGSNTPIGCKQYGSPVQSYAPTGSLDTLNFFPDGSPVLYGWAADRNDLAQTLEVHLYVDGARGFVSRTGNYSRPDVAAAFGAPNAGFVATLPPQGPGRHTICAYAINIGPAGANTQLGCKTYGDAPAPLPTTTTPPPPTTTPPPPANVYYPNCDAVRAAGRAPLLRGQPGYRSGLDRDNDGKACDIV